MLKTEGNSQVWSIMSLNGFHYKNSWMWDTRCKQVNFSSLELFQVWRRGEEQQEKNLKPKTIQELITGTITIPMISRKSCVHHHLWRRFVLSSQQTVPLQCGLTVSWRQNLQCFQLFKSENTKMEKWKSSKYLDCMSPWWWISLKPWLKLIFHRVWM